MYGGVGEAQRHDREEGMVRVKSGHSVLSEVARGFLPAVCLMA